MSGLINIDLSKAISVGGNIIDDLFTSDEERLAIALQSRRIEADTQTGQMEVNKTEATHKSLFVAGWRPFIGWVGGFALGYKFIFYQMILWVWGICQAKNWIPVNLSPPPSVNAQELYPIILGMLGLGGMRTYEGVKNVKTNSLGDRTKKESKFRWPWSKS